MAGATIEAGGWCRALCQASMQAVGNDKGHIHLASGSRLHVSPACGLNGVACHGCVGLVDLWAAVQTCYTCHMKAEDKQEVVKRNRGWLWVHSGMCCPPSLIECRLQLGTEVWKVSPESI